ncbi:MAG: asparagine synthase-related protein [Thermoplasmata archaeon]
MKTDDILEVLKEAVRAACMGEERVALAFSGGLDSSVIAALASDFVSVVPYTVGYPSSQDLVNARTASGALGLPMQPIHLDDLLLIREARALLKRFPDLSPVTLSFELPLWILLQRCQEGLVLAGQGADELFGGYARYVSLEPADLQKNLERDLTILLNDTIPRETEMARLHDKELRLPYCHPSVIAAALSLPVELKGGPRRKEALRRVAERLGLPTELVERPKKAVQYGSGVMKRLRVLARREGQGMRDFLLSLAGAR